MQTKCTQDDLANWASMTFDVTVGRSTVGKIVSDQTVQIPPNPEQKRRRTSRYPELEMALYEFVLEYQEKTSITDMIILEKAKKLFMDMNIQDEELKFSNGWLTRFKKRHGISLRKLHGESASVETSELNVFRAQLSAIIDNYEPCDVFNMDETGLFYRMEPSKSLGTKSLKGRKKDKDRITIGLCANMDGSEKLEPIVIGKSIKPRCFKGINTSTLGVRYYANLKAWMTRQVFTEWLKQFNCKMHGRKVLLLIDNAPSHISLELNNVRVEFLPKNTTAFLQPMDAGIIQNFKVKYKTKLVQWIIDRLECSQPTRIDLHSTILFVVDSWKNVSSNTIRNCWGQTRIMSGVHLALIHADNDPKKESELGELDVMIKKLNIVDPLDASEYLDDDNLVHYDSPSESVMSDSDSDQEESRVISHQQALMCAVDLHTYLISNGPLSPSESRVMNEILAKCRLNVSSHLRQTSLLQYFPLQ